ncbi:MAG: radical SAM protein [Bacteroidota bacterium]|nr:radical SAM protein [Bacteroidota bacterium]
MKLENLVLKVTSKCNLNCSYCYVFNKGDKSFKKEPSFLDLRTSEKLLYRLNNHIKKHNLKTFLLIFHGGEPLLVGKKFYSDFIELANKIITDIKIDFALQTNGTLLNEEWCDLFKRLKINIGVSMDGTPFANENRVYRKDKTSAYTDILKGIETLKDSYNEVAILSVINTKEEPIKVYEHFKKIGITHGSFLFPDLNYDQVQDPNDIPKVGEWLIKLFDLWYDDTETRPMFRPFNFLCQKILGYTELGNEMFGTNENAVLTVKTNGDIEAVDSLRICGNGFTRTNLNVDRNELDDLFKDNLFKNYYYAHSDDYLSKNCLECEIKELCGGGQLAHRFSNKNNFDNPSVYCNQIYNLIRHIQNRLLADLPENIINDCKIEKIGYYENV